MSVPRKCDFWNSPRSGTAVNDAAENCCLGIEPQFDVIGFAISDCVVQIEKQSAKYLRAVHRTALELAIHNYFGAEIGGFWMLHTQIDQLRKLADYYPVNEALQVRRAVEAYLKAQLRNHLFKKQHLHRNWARLVVIA